MFFSKSHFSVLLFACALMVSSCELGDEQPSGLYQTGVFITNEGPFGSGTGTVSYYDRDVDALKNDIFGTENGGATIGNVLQSLTLNNGKGYLIANNANKLVVVDPKTFKTESSLATGLSLPRYFFHIDANRAYITQFGTDSATSGVAVYDYTTKTIAKVIPTGKGADRILNNTTSGGIWVTNSGGLSKDSTVAIISSTADSVVQKIKVGLGPNSMVQDANGDVWVLCGGYFDRVGSGKLVKIRNGAVELSFDVPKYASNLILDKAKTTLYFLADNQIYTKDLLNFGANAPSVFLKPASATYLYSLGFDARTGYLWCGDALDFKQSGAVYIIDPTTKTEKKKLTVGIAPNGFVFQ
ncbi:MAG: hypothetical protein JNL70_04585 [Saprospiraceae bacterium]|nr:hypothetical protein [Saprospiraceae bacterium]